jgi:hypothetical protein
MVSNDVCLWSFRWILGTRTTLPSMAGYTEPQTQLHMKGAISASEAASRVPPLDTGI